MYGFNVCYSHGAPRKIKPNDPPRKTKNGLNSTVFRKYKNKLNKTAQELGIDLSQGLKHGFLAFEILTVEERRDFLHAVKQLHDDFLMNKSSDFYATELVATNLIMFRRAVKNGDVKAAEAYDRMVRLHLGDLKATKNAREGGTVTVKTTPAEWAASILNRKDADGTQDTDAPDAQESKNSVAFDEDGTQENPDEHKTVN